MARVSSFAAGAGILGLLLFGSPSDAGQATMTVEPLDLSFGTQEVGTESTAQTITIYNAPGGSPLSYDVFLDTGDTADFVLSCPEWAPDCLDAALGAGFYTEFYVAFAPIASGQRTATVRVLGNDPKNEFDDVVLSGLAIDTIFVNGFEPSDPAWSDCVGGSCT